MEIIFNTICTTQWYLFPYEVNKRLPVLTLSISHYMFFRSNCDPAIREELRTHYQLPYFLPSQSETSEQDWIFMGGPGPGAQIHVCLWHLLKYPELGGQVSQNLHKFCVKTNTGKQNKQTFVAIDLWQEIPSKSKDLNQFACPCGWSPALKDLTGIKT